jgi:predicted ATP-grasp superfamily ATP-dependent carboligase
VVGVKSKSVVQNCHSRYLHRTYTIEPTEDALLPFLASLADEGGVLFPVYDQYLRLVSMHADALSKRFALTIPRWEILGRVMDHARLYALAQQAGIATPAFQKPRDEVDLKRIIAGLDLGHCEYLIKTMPAIGPAEIATGRATKVAGTDPAKIYDDCVEIFARLGDYPLLVEVVPGEANDCYGVTMVVDRSQTPRLTYCTRRLRLQLYSRGGFVHPYELGSNVYCESVHDDEAVAAAMRVVKAAGYHGLITLEFRRDPRDRTLILIKADPRVVRATGLSTALGLDTPTALYHLAVEGALDAPQAYPDGLGWLWETALLETFWNNRDSRSMRQELRAIGRNRRRIKAYAYYSRSDLLPFVMHAQWRTRAWVWARVRGIARRGMAAVKRRSARPPKVGLGG